MNTEKAIDLLDNLIGMAIDALKAQSDGDTISRKATIDAMEGVDWYHIDSDGQLVHGANSKEGEPLYKAEDVYKVLNDMPSAQPEKRTENTRKTHGVCLDTISRQAAIPPTLYGYPVEHLVLIARVLQKENFPPERIAEMLSDVGRIVDMVRDEFEETLRKAVEQCMMT